MGMSFGGTGGNASLTSPVNLRSAGTSPVFGAGTTGDAFNRAELDADGGIRLGGGAAPVDTLILRTGANTVQVPGLNTTLSIGCQGIIDVTTVGKGLAVAEGTNGKQGTAVLAAGTVTVANANVTANSRILLTSQADGGTPGFLRVSARVAGTSFTITSSSATDTSTVAYEIFEPG